MPDRLKVKHIRSSQFGKSPSASTIDYGEIAINYNSESPALYIKDNLDNIVPFVSEPYFEKIVGTGITEDSGETFVPLTKVIQDDEKVISAALNDLESRKADKSYVDDAVSSITIDVDTVLSTGSSNPVANSALTAVIYENELITSSALNDLEDRKADKSYVDAAVSSITIDVDYELDSGSTNPVANSAITKVIIENEEVIAAAFNDLETRKADKSYVDAAVSSITIDADSELSTGSTNPVQNSAITTYIYDIEEVTSAALNDLNTRKADKSYVDDAVSSITIDVDSELDSASTNPVENQVIWSAMTEMEFITTTALNDLNDRVEDLEENEPNDGVLTIQKNGTQIGRFTANSETSTTVNIQVKEVPASTSADSGKVLMVNSSGQAVWTLPSNIYSGNVQPSQQLGNNGDIYIQTS